MYEYYLLSPPPNELYHHGIQGMKWGVRRFQNKDGSLTSAGKKRYVDPSSRQVKKYIKKSGNENVNKVRDEWSKEKLNNEQYKKLGELSDKLAYQIIKSEENDYKRNPDGEISEKTKALYKRHLEVDSQMLKIEIDIGKKYIDNFNEARLKDIVYTGTTENGKKMLEKYGQNFTVRSDGTIRSGSGYGRYDYIHDYDDNYIRPRNM